MASGMTSEIKDLANDTKLTSGDLNNVTEPGVYYLGATGSAFTNCPSAGGWSHLMVLTPSSTFIFQMIVKFNNIFTRDYSGNPQTWQAWRTYSPEKFKYGAGDTCTTKAFQIGRIVNAKNGVYIAIPVDKPITATSASIALKTANVGCNLYPTTESLATAIADAGYGTNNIIDKTAFPITANSVEGNIVTAVIPLKTALSSVDNPRTFEVEIDGITITFS